MSALWEYLSCSLYQTEFKVSVLATDNRSLILFRDISIFLTPQLVHDSLLKHCSNILHPNAQHTTVNSHRFKHERPYIVPTNLTFSHYDKSHAWKVDMCELTYSWITERTDGVKQGDL